MRFLMDFSYSGNDFNGYQKQLGKRTVQEEIEKILTSINNDKKVIISSSGRTDAKVNALHQKAHFDLNMKITPYKLKGALNSYLPCDIHVNDIKIVDEKFHARYMVKYKIYEYKINTKEYNPLLRTQVFQYCKPLNVDKMKEALNYFKGTHDFTTFTTGENKKQNNIRKISSVSIKQKDGIITIRFKANGFLKYQVRNMVGTLVKVGEEKISADMIPILFDKKDRKYAFLCAPGNGLTLVDVIY